MSDRVHRCHWPGGKWRELPWIHTEASHQGRDLHCLLPPPESRLLQWSSLELWNCAATCLQTLHCLWGTLQGSQARQPQLQPNLSDVLLTLPLLPCYCCCQAHPSSLHLLSLKTQAPYPPRLPLCRSHSHQNQHCHCEWAPHIHRCMHHSSWAMNGKLSKEIL